MNTSALPFVVPDRARVAILRPAAGEIVVVAGGEEDGDAATDRFFQRGREVALDRRRRQAAAMAEAVGVISRSDLSASAIAIRWS